MTINFNEHTLTSCFYYTGLHTRGVGGGRGLQYEIDGDACHLAQGSKFWILISHRVFWAKRQYFMPPRSCLGFREETVLREEKQRSNFLLNFPFRLKAFDDYAFTLLKLIACHIFVFLNGIF